MWHFLLIREQPLISNVTYGKSFAVQVHGIQVQPNWDDYINLHATMKILEESLSRYDCLIDKIKS